MEFCKTVIVRVGRNSKPTVFSTHKHWYRSIVAVTVQTETSTHLGAEGDHDRLLHVYKTVFHGFSATLTEVEAARMGKTPGVLDQVRQLQKETEVIREVASRAVKDLPNSLDVGTSMAQESLESAGQVIDDN